MLSTHADGDRSVTARLFPIVTLVSASDYIFSTHEPLLPGSSSEPIPIDIVPAQSIMTIGLPQHNDVRAKVFAPYLHQLDVPGSGHRSVTSVPAYPTYAKLNHLSQGFNMGIGPRTPAIIADLLGGSAERYSAHAPRWDIARDFITPHHPTRAGLPYCEAADLHASPYPRLRALSIEASANDAVHLYLVRTQLLTSSDNLPKAIDQLSALITFHAQINFWTYQFDMEPISLINYAGDGK